MKKEKTWKNPNKMNIDTGNATFDRKCKVISRGNVISSTQLSNYIRTSNTLENCGNKFDKGHLQNFDLDCLFNDWSHLKRKIGELADKNNGIIVYQFFHRNGKNRVDHCLIVTTTDHKEITTFRKRFNEKAYNLVNEIKSYIIEK